MTETTQTIDHASIPQEERTLAALTHLSGLAGYILPLGGVIVPIIILLVKGESRVISTVAKQALLLNVVIFIAGLAGFALFLTIILIPLVIVYWIALALAAIALPIVGALKANDGEYYQYPIIGLRLP